MKHHETKDFGLSAIFPVKTNINSKSNMKIVRGDFGEITKEQALEES